MLFWAIASILAQLVSTFNLNVTEFYTLKAQKAVFSNSTVLFIMSVVVIAAASAAINARLREDRKRAESYKARENIEISTRIYRERAAAERKEKEARERVEYEARVKVERAATEAKERDASEARERAAAARMNQQKNEEMAAAKSKNLLKRLLQCWKFYS